MNINTNWHIITGGPCSGKTKTIEYLAFLGYATVPEAARVLIDIEEAKGKTINEIRHDEIKFQDRALKMKIEVENRIPIKRMTFFDRGIPDSIAYYQICGKNALSIIKNIQKRKYKQIFLLDQLPFEKDYARIENEKLSNKLNHLLYKAYSDLGYNIISVPPQSIEQRAKFILNKLNINVA